ITQAAQLFEHADQRQPFPRRLALVPDKDPIQLILVGPDLGHRLNGSLVLKRRLSRPKHLPHDLARDLQLSAERLDRLALKIVRPPYPGNRLHYQHPKTGSPTTSVSTVNPSV